MARERPANADATYYLHALRFLTPKGELWRRVNVRPADERSRKMTRRSLYVRPEIGEELVKRMREDGLVVHSWEHPTDEEQSRRFTEMAATMRAGDVRSSRARLHVVGAEDPTAAISEVRQAAVQRLSKTLRQLAIEILRSMRGAGANSAVVRALELCEQTQRDLDQVRQIDAKAGLFGMEVAHAFRGWDGDNWLETSLLDRSLALLVRRLGGAGNGPKLERDLVELAHSLASRDALD